MKLKELRRIIDDKTNVSLYDGRPIYDDHEWFNKSFLVEDINDWLPPKYDECEVYGIWYTENALCIAVNARIEVTAKFTTDICGYTFDKKETYDLLDYDDKDELMAEIDGDFDDWLEDLTSELRGYAEKEVEGL